MNENEKPVIGSSEATVLTVVELIARAAQMSEQHLAYWLDLYYQVRSRHEKDMTPLDFSELMVKVEEPDPVRVQLDRVEDKLNEVLDHLKHRYDAADAAAFALAGIMPTHAPAQALTLTPDDIQVLPDGRIRGKSGVFRRNDEPDPAPVPASETGEKPAGSKKTEADGRGSPQGPEEDRIG